MYPPTESVSIPLLRLNAVFTDARAKEHSLVLSAQVISKWPDQVRMKISKAEYHLISLIVKGHAASMYFPRTNKLFETELNKPLIDQKDAADIVSAAIEMSAVFVKGPFPDYPLQRYAYKGREDGEYVFAAEIPGGTLKLYIDPSSFYIRRRVYTLKAEKEWTVDILFRKYERIQGQFYPRKLSMEISTAGDTRRSRMEMYVSRISFHRPVRDQAFETAWPEDALRLKVIPSDPEELFGKIEDEEEKQP